MCWMRMRSAPRYISVPLGAPGLLRGCAEECSGGTGAHRT